jgi:hypothetical protein
VQVLLSRLQHSDTFRCVGHSHTSITEKRGRTREPGCSGHSFPTVASAPHKTVRVHSPDYIGIAPCLLPHPPNVLCSAAARINPFEQGRRRVLSTDKERPAYLTLNSTAKSSHCHEIRIWPHIRALRRLLTAFANRKT